VRPFSLSATINDLTIFEPDGKTPMVTLGEAEANTSAASIWHLAPVVDSLHVDALSVHVVRDAEWPHELCRCAGTLRRAAAEAGRRKPARFSVSNIAVTNTSFVYEDKLLDTVQRVENFTLTLPFLSNLPHDVMNTAPSCLRRSTVAAGAGWHDAAVSRTRMNQPQHQPGWPRGSEVHGVRAKAEGC
jgi:hypothetical protein